MLIARSNINPSTSLRLEKIKHKPISTLLLFTLLSVTNLYAAESLIKFMS